MCFSAHASFGAAIALGAIGVLAVRAAPTRRHLPLAAIPLLFAAQQACEGALWLELDAAPFHLSDTPLVRAFLFFALLVWPAWVPFALACVEPVRTKRNALVAMSVAGALLGAYLMGCASLRASNACVAFDNLYYWVQIDAPFKHAVLAPYLALVAVPPVVSSLRGTSLLALVTVLTFSATGMLYRAGFVSVWCFLAALLSGIVALVVTMSRPAVRQRRDALAHDVAERANLFDARRG